MNKDKLSEARAWLTEARVALQEEDNWDAFDHAWKASLRAVQHMYVVRGLEPPTIRDAGGTNPTLHEALDAILPEGWYRGKVNACFLEHRLVSFLGGCWSETFSEPEHQLEVAELVDTATYVLWLAEALDGTVPLGRHGSVTVRRRGRTYSVEDGLGLIARGPTAVIDGQTVDTGSLKLRRFLEHGTNCVACELEGMFFALENVESQNFTGWTLNLYGVNTTGAVLLTRDHRVPLARGGPDDLSNLQTMCWPCNSQKGARLP